MIHKVLGQRHKMKLWLDQLPNNVLSWRIKGYVKLVWYGENGDGVILFVVHFLCGRSNVAMPYDVAPSGPRTDLCW